MKTLKKTDQVASDVTLRTPPANERSDEPDEGVDFSSAPLELKNIVVPIDFSKISRKALEYAVPLAKHFGAKITLLHAIKPLPYPSELAFVPDRESFPIQPLEEQLADLAKHAFEPELLSQIRVTVGEPFDVITNVARELKADLIIITTHGYTGLKHVLMGSTAERVVRYAPCPVLVVRKVEHRSA